MDAQRQDVKYMILDELELMGDALAWKMRQRERIKERREEDDYDERSVIYLENREGI